jgi:hypothetical protein
VCLTSAGLDVLDYIDDLFSHEKVGTNLIFTRALAEECYGNLASAFVIAHVDPDSLE